MANKIEMQSGFKLCLMAFWLVITLAGLTRYQGSGLMLSAFSFIFFILIFDSLRRSCGMSYGFLVVFMTLGIWAKLMLHLLITYDYMEPIGYFSGTPQAWDHVLLVSITGVAGVLAAKNLFLMARKFSSKLAFSPPPLAVPAWYPRARSRMWCATIIAFVGLAVLNLDLGIAQVGLVPRQHLPWPLNGLIAWLLGFGLIAWILTLLAWDIACGRGIKMGLTATLAEGFLSTISILSRAGYLFHTIPPILLLIFRRKVLKASALHFVVLVWFVLFATSLVIVNHLRYGDQRPIATGEAPHLLERIPYLIIDRWIGLEGVMAVTAYPEKDMSLLEAGLQDRRVHGELDLYTLSIARVDGKQLDFGLNQYATLPGAIAFFYYSGSLGWVFFGMFGVVLLMCGIERLVLFISGNIFLAAFWSMSTAQAVASFGVGVLQTVLYFGFCGCFVLVLAAVSRIKPLPQKLMLN